MPPVINREKCVKCGKCAEICPLDVIHVSRDGSMDVTYPDECWHCRSCVIECGKDAITMRYPLSHMMLHVNVPGKGGAGK